MLIDKFLQGGFGWLAAQAAIDERANALRQRQHRYEEPEQQEGAERPQHDRPEHAA